MKNLTIRTQAGVSVELTETDMMHIHKHYEVQSTADYLRVSHVDWEEDKIQQVAGRVRELMNEYNHKEETAIALAILEKEQPYDTY